MQFHLSTYEDIGENMDLNLKMLHFLLILVQHQIQFQENPTVIFLHTPDSLALLKIAVGFS